MLKYFMEKSLENGYNCSFIGNFLQDVLLCLHNLRTVSLKLEKRINDKFV